MWSLFWTLTFKRKENTMSKKEVLSHVVTPRVVTMVLAGGKGTRLAPLTNHRAKPSVPFAGKFRIIDFTLANAVNSGYRKIFVLLQYASRSLLHHLQRIWNTQTGRGDFVEGLFPKMRYESEFSFVGTADAVYQNWRVLEEEDPDLVLILNGDHIYKMDYRQLVSYHLQKKSDFTICATRVPVDVAAGQLGVLVVDGDYRVIGFEEKPEVPTEIPGDSGYCLASMGNYVLPLGIGGEILKQDAEDSDSDHDFGKNIIPSIVDSNRVFVYPFESNRIKGEIIPPSWSDVGTTKAYFDVCMDLCEPTPRTNLYNTRWPIPSGTSDLTAPAKFVQNRLLTSGSTIINDAKIWFAILHREVRVEDGANLDHCIIMDKSTVGFNANLRNTIVDKDVNIPDDIRIGFDIKEDKARGFTVEPFDGGWITVVPKLYVFQ